jgi:hypothetical protein
MTWGQAGIIFGTCVLATVFFLEAGAVCAGLYRRIRRSRRGA